MSILALIIFYVCLLHEDYKSSVNIVCFITKYIFYSLRNSTFDKIPKHLEKWRKDRPTAMSQGEAVVQMQEILKERGIDI